MRKQRVLLHDAVWWLTIANSMVILFDRLVTIFLKLKK